MNIKSIFTGIGGVVVTLALGVLLGTTVFRPKSQPVVTPPAVILHDTVTVTKFKFDSLALAKAIAALKPDTVWVTREIVAPPETVSVFPPLNALTMLHAGEQLGDTGYAQGFEEHPLSGGKYSFHKWQTQWVTPGPLGSVIMDSAGLRLHFYAEPPPPCTFMDNRKHELFGAAGITIIRALLGK